MKRRTFLFGSLAIPALAAVKPSFSAPPNPSTTLFTCVVGDFERNANGHVYTPKQWRSMFPFAYSADDPSRNMPYCVWDNSEVATIGGVSLTHIAGRLTDFLVGPEFVTVTMRVLETPMGKLFKSVVHAAPLFLTPTGKGSFIENTGEIRNYVLSHFSISNSSAFDCATPLKPLETVYV